jgi:hypothetical protein
MFSLSFGLYTIFAIVVTVGELLILCPRIVPSSCAQVGYTQRRSNRIQVEHDQESQHLLGSPALVNLVKSSQKSYQVSV